MEVVKCVLLDTVVVKSTQRVVQKYALAIVDYSCIHTGLD
jgi:hypothetical protein